MILSALISAPLIFGMFGATSIAGVVVFGIFMEFFLAAVGGLNILDKYFTNFPSGVNCCTCGRVFCDASRFCRTLGVYLTSIFISTLR